MDGKILKFIKFMDFVVISIVLLLSIITFFIKNSDAEKRFYLFIEDKKIKLPIEDKIIDLKEYGKNVLIEVKGAKIGFIQSDCQDKICIRTGFIDDCGESAVCLPNKVAVQIECEENEFDAISR